jgi:YjjG family noncanonical pyrimidine nucleotidase
MRYKGIFIDADDTLFDFHAGEKVAAGRVLEFLKIKEPGALEAYSEINAALWRDLEKGMTTQAKLKVRRFELLMARYGVTGSPEAAAKYYVEALSEQSMLLPGALEAVERIAAVLPVSIVTNGISFVQRGRMGRSPLRHLIRDFVVSEEIGFAKPDPKVLEIALTNLGVAPRDALMAGDGMADMRCAQNANVDGCWVNPHGKALPEDLKPQYEIADISLLPEIALQ